jgi:hypothetical protein
MVKQSSCSFGVEFMWSWQVLITHDVRPSHPKKPILIVISRQLCSLISCIKDGKLTFMDDHRTTMCFSLLLPFSQVLAITAYVLGNVLPGTRGTDLSGRATGTKYVFAHFMVSILCKYHVL